MSANIRLCDFKLIYSSIKKSYFVDFNKSTTELYDDLINNIKNDFLIGNCEIILAGQKLKERSSPITKSSSLLKDSILCNSYNDVAFYIKPCDVVNVYGECVICSNENCRLLKSYNCCHLFCHDCLRLWQNKSCPLCRCEK